MLCETCSTTLRNTHFLIQKALESYRILKQTFNKNLDTDGSEEQKHCDQKLYPSDFETLFVQQSTESLINVDNESKNFMKDTSMEIQNTITSDEDQKCIQLPTKERSMDFHNTIISDIGNIKLEKSPEFLESGDEPRTITTKSCKRITKTTSKVSKVKKNKSHKHPDFPEDVEKIIDIPKSPNSLCSEKKPKPVTKTLRKKTSIMCSYCPRIVSFENIKSHEKTHEEHRERSHICTICGVKLLTKPAMYCHMRIHKENREKRFKCDFCEKAYYHRGGLNVHRRIHLGQMIPCTVCSKEFFRQIDIDKHMSSHNVTPINANIKSKVKYQVECKECGKMVNSAYFKGHQAFHLNKPVVKCNICDKDFFCMSKCSQHMKRVHKKSRHECTTYYEENNGERLTHLLMEQQEKIAEVAK